MGNIFKIKRGNSKPTLLNLIPFELGWNIKDKKLYINNNGEEIVDINKTNFELVDLFYPVGTLYWTQGDVNPNTLWTGTIWEKITNKFIYASEGGGDYWWSFHCNTYIC